MQRAIKEAVFIPIFLFSAIRAILQNEEEQVVTGDGWKAVIGIDRAG